MIFILINLFFQYSSCYEEYNQCHGVNINFEYIVTDHFSLNFDNSFCLFVPSKNHLFVRIFLDTIGKSKSLSYKILIIISNKKISFQIFESGKRVSKYKNINSPTYLYDCVSQLLINNLNIISNYSQYKNKIEKYEMSLITNEKHFKNAKEISKAASDVSGFIYIIIVSEDLFKKIGEGTLYLYKRNNGEYIQLNGDIPSFFNIDKNQIQSSSLSYLLSSKNNNGTLICIKQEMNDKTKQFFSKLSNEIKTVQFRYITNHSSKELIQLLDLEFRKKYDETVFVFIKIKNNEKIIYVKIVVELNQQEIEKFIKDSLNNKLQNHYISELNTDNSLYPLTHLTGNTYIDFITQENKIPIIFYYNSKHIQQNDLNYKYYLENFWNYASKMVNSSNSLFEYGYINVDMNSCVVPFPYFNSNEPYLFAQINEFMYMRIPLTSMHVIDFFVNQVIMPLLAMNSEYPFEQIIEGKLPSKHNSFEYYIENYVYLRNMELNPLSEFMHEYDFLSLKEIVLINNRDSKK